MPVRPMVLYGIARGVPSVAIAVSLMISGMKRPRRQLFSVIMAAPPGNAETLWHPDRRGGERGHAARARP